MLKIKSLFLKIKRVVFLLISMFFVASIYIYAGPTKTLWSVSAFGGENYFYQPSDIEIDHNRSLIYVVDTGNHCVFVFDFQGKFLESIGNEGQGPGELSRPTGLHIMEDSSVVVADKGNNRIQTFDSAWKFSDSINTKSIEVADLIIIQDNIYTIWSYGMSGFSLNMGLKENTQKRQQKQVGNEDMSPAAMRTEVIDPRRHKVIRYIEYDGGARNFAVMKDDRLVYLHEDSEGDLHLKCIQY